MNRRSFLFGLASAAAAQHIDEPPTPRPGHPRLYFRDEHVGLLRARLAHPVLARAVTRLRSNASALTTNLTAERAAEIARSRAFLAVLENNETLGRSAVQLLLQRIPSATWDLTIGDISRAIGLVMVSVGMVYDWCYPWLDDHGPDLIREAYRLARMLEIGYPPTGQGAITGHAGEAMLLRDLLGTGLAIHDESPEMYQLSAARIYREFVAPRNFFYPSHVHHQGSAYGPYRYRWELQAAWILERAGLGNPFVRDQADLPYRWIYTERPDARLLPEGDVFQGRPATPAYMLCAGLYGDGYVRDRYLAQTDALDQDPIEQIAFADPDVERRPIHELPLARYFPAPYSGVVMRTAWNRPEDDPAIVEFKIKEWHFNNHQHLDAGTFQIWFRGPLALDSGLYRLYFTPHDGNYLKRTVAHNAMLVIDPAAGQVAGRWMPDGGQRWPNDAREPRTLSDLHQRGYRVARTTGHQIGGEAWAYLEGDLTDAYLPAQVEKHQRAFMYLRAPAEGVECALIVLDRLRAGQPSFSKRWLLHTASQPEVGTSGTRSGNGRAFLSHEVLLPVADERRIEVVGGAGAEFTTAGRNYPPDVPPQPVHEAGEWRVEVISTAQRTDDLFLNVLSVGEAAGGSLVQTGAHTGVLLGRTLVLFAEGRVIEEVRIDLPGDGAYRCLVAGLSGGAWQVQQGATSRSVDVSGDSGVAEFEAAGAVVLRHEAR